MKGENKSWKEIMAELGRGKHILTARWKEINVADDGNAGDAAKKDEGDGGKKGGKKGGKSQENDNNNKAGGGDKGENKKKDKNQNQNQNAEKQAAEKKSAPREKPPFKAASVRSTGEARFTFADVRTLEEDELFSFGELQFLSELLMHDDYGRWLRIASRFFDKTGRRIAPEDVRDKFIELARSRA